MWVSLYNVSETTPHGTAVIDVAAEVRAMIARQRLSQTVVADRADIARSTLSRKLQGATPFTIDELYRLAEVFGIDAAELLPATRVKASA